MTTITDQGLIEALRRRMMRELEHGQHGGGGVTNNVYGGHIPSMGAGGGDGGDGGMLGRMGQMEENPRDQQYFVDIARENLGPGDEYEMGGEKHTAKHGGWKKRVHRFVVGGKKKEEVDLP